MADQYTDRIRAILNLVNEEINLNNLTDEARFHRRYAAHVAVKVAERAFCTAVVPYVKDKFNKELEGRVQRVIDEEVKAAKMFLLKVFIPTVLGSVAALLTILKFIFKW